MSSDFMGIDFLVKRNLRPGRKESKLLRQNPIVVEG
jgi:hypothetical protein